MEVVDSAILHSLLLLLFLTFQAVSGVDSSHNGLGLAYIDDHCQHILPRIMASEAEDRTGETSTSQRSTVISESDKSRQFARLSNAIIRGAGTGLCIRGGLHLLSWIFALFSRSRRNKLALDALRAILQQILDTIRYTLFLGSLSGVYVGVDESIANRYGRQK